MKGGPSSSATTSSTGIAREEGDEGRAGDVLFLILLLEVQGSCNKQINGEKQCNIGTKNCKTWILNYKFEKKRETKKY